MKNDLTLPVLFSITGEPVYAVVGDTLLFYFAYEESENPIVPINSYNMLMKFYQSPLKTKIIPKELEQFFSGKESVSSTTTLNFDQCLLTYCNAYQWNGWLCITYNLEINAQRKKSIILDNFSLSKNSVYLFDPRYPFENYNEYRIINDTITKIKVELFPLEAFLLFANICVSSFNEEIFNLNKEFDYKNETIKNQYLSLERIFYFAQEYLTWLKGEFQDGRLDPWTILRLNGCRVLSYLLDEPAVQELMYETLRKLQQYATLSQKELLLYHSFYIRYTHQSYFDILRRWGKITKELADTKPIAPEISTAIDEIFKTIQLKKLN
ncbi:MAG: hypothetical protein JXA54_14440 [Candidatus Heimdallarchaeota archaeon]|nr:hypothetical protein [Candidatus Heimdallarchaeota archaeon]